MYKITDLHAREILDSRGNPTIEVDLQLNALHWGRTAVPSGASTGAFEAHELRDGDISRYMGKGVLKAVKYVNETLGSILRNKSFANTESLDEFLIQEDNTENKTHLGANTILGISLSFLKAVASVEGVSLYKYTAQSKALRIPTPMMNILNGGAHADNGVDVQEFMIVPVVQDSFSESLRAVVECFQSLKSLLKKKNLSTAVGDEGGFAPNIKNNRQALELIAKAIEKAGYLLGEDVLLALDVASTEFYDNGLYRWEGRSITFEDMTQIYKSWTKDFPIISIEDGCAEEDWEGWKYLTKTLGKTVQIVGDDLFVTNTKRLQKGIASQAANSLLVKVNQIGSFTETVAAINLAHENGYTAVMSHRSGETEDTTIADLSVGLGCEQIKTGSVCRSERTAKYNQLLRIEEACKGDISYWGRKAFNV